MFRTFEPVSISSPTKGMQNHLIEKSNINSSDNTNDNIIKDNNSHNGYSDNEADNNNNNNNNATGTDVASNARGDDDVDDHDDYDEEMRIWLQKVINLSKNDPNWMDMATDAVIATVFAAKYLVQSLTKESSLIASYRQKPVPASLNGTGLPQEQEDKQDQPPLQLNYNDIADCISIKDQFGFLSGMIPRTKSLRELIAENKIRYTTFINPEETIQLTNVIQIDLNNNDEDDDTEDDENENEKQQ